MSSTVDSLEIENFSKDAGRWWDEDGPFAPLHRMGPVRLAHIKQQICDHFGLDDKGLKPFSKLNMLDIGCGGGLICEPMARLGGNITGVDADPVAIEVAQAHAQETGLTITYHNQDASALKKKFDVVLALEIIEHVSNPEEFVAMCAKLVKPSGLIIFSTLNRTPKSYALGIVAAEYILNWVPRGTHSWKKFIKPSELSQMARAHKLKPADITGLTFNPLKNEFELSKTDIGVNYFMSLTRQRGLG